MRGKGETEDRLCQCSLHTGAIVFLGRGPQGVAESSAPETRDPRALLYRDPLSFSTPILFMHLVYLCVNYSNVLCLTCLQVQTLIDNDSDLNVCVFSPRIIVPPQHLSHAHYMHFAASSLCHVSVLAIKFFIRAWTVWLLHCYDHVKWTAENGYVENSMWCARWEEEWENSSAFQFHVFQSQHFLSGVHGWNFACKSYSIAYSLTNGVRSKQGASSTISRLTQCSGGSSSVVIFIPVLLVKSIRSINFDRYVHITFFFLSFFLRIHLI